MKDNIAEKKSKVNVLGITWDTETDELGYHTGKQMCKPTHLTTKRDVVQDVSKIVYPYGLLSPVQVRESQDSHLRTMEE